MAAVLFFLVSTLTVTPSLKSFRVFVFRFLRDEIVIEIIVEKFKRGPVLWDFVPTFAHQFVERVGAVLGFGHSVTVLNLFQNFGI